KGRKAQKKDHHNRSSKPDHGSHAKGHENAKTQAHGHKAKKPNKPCPGCGGSHWRNECKFKDAKCNSCGAIGHIST
ncbi:hypothetical protein AAVH_29270, partial [Aphelenchoides avenae]